MTDSIFDPTGSATEHSGSRNLGPSADNISHMPPSIAAGQAQPNSDVRDEDAKTKEIAAAEKEHSEENERIAKSRRED